MTIEIVTPKNTTTFTDVKNISLPGSEGRFMVLTGHAPLLSALVAGNVNFVRNEKEEKIAVAGGVVSVLYNMVRIISE